MSVSIFFLTYRHREQAPSHIFYRIFDLLSAAHRTDFGHHKTNELLNGHLLAVESHFIVGVVQLGNHIGTHQGRQLGADRHATDHFGRHLRLLLDGFRVGHATGLGLQDARTWQLGNTAVNRLLWTPDSGLSLIGWADGTHLEDHALDESTA